MSYVGFFEIGLGPIPWLLVAEVFDSKYVATAQSLCCQVNWVCNFVIGAAFPTLNAFCGVYTFLPFMAVLVFFFGFVNVYMPETLHLTVEEIQKLVNVKLPLSVGGGEDFPQFTYREDPPAEGFNWGGGGGGGGGGMGRYLPGGPKQNVEMTRQQGLSNPPFGQGLSNPPFGRPGGLARTALSDASSAKNNSGGYRVHYTELASSSEDSVF